jgi:RNA polymerase sigma factor (sigma-70 family)
LNSSLGRKTADLQSPETDGQLAAGFRHDPELFTAVYDRYFRDVYRYLAGRLGPHAADDIAAETFLEAFRQRDRFDPRRGGLRPWLFGIATNLVARHQRSEARYYRTLARRGPERAADSHEERVIASVTAQRLRGQLAGALAALSAGERDVVLLVAIGQLSHREVAEALGISYGTVGSRLSRARTSLKVVLDVETLHG